MMQPRDSGFENDASILALAAMDSRVVQSCLQCRLVSCERQVDEVEVILFHSCDMLRTVPGRYVHV